MPATSGDEGTGCPSSDTTLPQMETETVVALETEKTSSSISNAADSVAMSNTSAIFQNELRGTTITPAADSVAERRNSGTSQVEQKGFKVGLDTESKIVDTSTATSDDSSDEAFREARKLSADEGKDMSTTSGDEGTGCPSSDTALPKMDIETVVALEAEKTNSSNSNVADSDAVSNTSVTFQNELRGTSITLSADSEAERKNLVTSQVEQKRFPTGLDTESKIVDTFDNDTCPPTTSDDSSDVGIKLINAVSSSCMCGLRSSTYAIVCYFTCYASLLIADSFGAIPPLMRILYAFKFQLFLTFEQQYALHGWLGIFLLLSAFVLWLGTFKRSRPILQVWMMVMLLFVMMDLTVWLLGFLLSFAADGWNVHSTTAISIGMLEVGMEVYLLHMVYTFNRYMFEKPPRHDFYDPRVMLRRQMELAQHGYHEINIMGVPLPAPIPGHPVHQIRAQQEQRQRQQQQRQQQQRQQVTAV